MQLSYLNLLPNNYAPNSKVWMYQSSRILTMREALQVEELLETFVYNWKAHGQAVKGFGTLLFGQFVLLIADEAEVTVSGCSIDGIVRLIKELEQLYKISLLDRQQLAFYKNEKIEVIPYSQVPYALAHGLISGDTLYFNNTVLTLAALQQEWIIPVKQSWLKSIHQKQAVT